ncbi:ABC transporter substrate-binding protein [Desulfitobacterium sp. AusDCA]|uniref:ABC transporter substrate-binding protein n=1 Tax=Desulfitobacterium sp. AusDCA TaxID=3240383 RepID=UPI003DA74771
MKTILKRPAALIFLIILVITIALFISVNPFSQTKANEPVKKIGVLMSSDFRLPKVEGVKKGLAEYHLIEGKTAAYIIKNANEKSELLEELAKQLVSEDPDVIFVTGESEALAAQKATQSVHIPIVFVGVGSAKEMGLVESYNSPGKNITGVENYYLILSGKRLEFFKRLLPEVKNIAIVYDPRVTPANPTLAFLRGVANKLELSIRPFPVTGREETLQVISGLDSKQVDGVMFLCSQLLESVTQEVNVIALDKHLPIMGVSEEQTQKGLLASYRMPYFDQGLQASRLIAKVLQGEDPSAIPVESPSKVEFVVNISTAKKLQLNLDPAGLTCVTKFLE